MITPFHIAVPVRDIAEAREFYGAKLGFREGRSSEHWIDFDMFGHQYVVHLDTSLDPSGNALEFKAFRDIERNLFAT